MKYTIVTCFIIFIIIGSFSCKKETEITILGKWNIINDSVNSESTLNTYNQNYIGKTGDYFDFRTDGKLYIKESQLLDTLNYSISSDNKIIIPPFAPIEISVLTSHSLNLYFPEALITADGFYVRLVNLSK